MKRVYLLTLALGALALTSCKKDYSCRCETKTSMGGNITAVEVFARIESANRVQAQAACNEASVIVDLGNNNYRTTACELK